MVETVKPTTRRGVRAPSAPVYTLGTNPAERERLQRQSHDLADHSLALLSRVDLPAGWPSARPRLRPGGDHRAARRACRANGLGRRHRHRPGPRRHGPAAGARPWPGQRRGAPGRRPPHRITVRLVRRRARPPGAGQHPVTRTGRRRDGALGETRRVGHHRRGGRHGGDLLSTRPGMGSAPRDPPRRLPAPTGPTSSSAAS